LWQGIWTYVQRHNIDVMFGCASLEGTDLSKLAEPLSFLHHTAQAPELYNLKALPSRYVSMDRMRADQVDMKSAMRALPPLIKGYLRLGAFVGDGAVVDHQFGTTDVSIILPVSRIGAKYIGYFGGRNRGEQADGGTEIN
jgi:putative hemolysin